MHKLYLFSKPDCKQQLAGTVMLYKLLNAALEMAVSLNFSSTKCPLEALCETNDLHSKSLKTAQ